MKLLFSCWMMAFFSTGLMSQPSAKDQAATAPPIDNGVTGILSNRRTADGTIPFEPISAKRKLTIAALDSVDYPAYILPAFIAGFGQLSNKNPSFGQGLKGYGKRYGTAYGDQLIDYLVVEGVLPVLLHEDPRYFRIGPTAGSTGYRLRYAITRIFIAKTDRNTARFNFSEIGGTAVSTAISNSYLPDQRNVHDNARRYGISLATDALSNVIREFGPDINRKMKARKAARAASRP